MQERFQSSSMSTRGTRVLFPRSMQKGPMQHVTIENCPYNCYFCVLVGAITDDKRLRRCQVRSGKCSCRIIRTTLTVCPIKAHSPKSYRIKSTQCLLALPTYFPTCGNYFLCCCCCFKLISLV